MLNILTVLAQYIDGLGVQLPPGLHIVGTVKVFFFEATGDITLDPRNQLIEIKIKLAPINWLSGLIRVSRVDDHQLGPLFYLKATAVCF